MLHLDYRDVRPLYAQLTDKIRQQISGGVLVQAAPASLWCWSIRE